MLGSSQKLLQALTDDGAPEMEYDIRHICLIISYM